MDTKIDKEILVQYCDLKEEVKDIRKRIDKLENAPKVLAVVEASAKEFPYHKHTIGVEGVNERREKSLKKHKRLLELKHDELLEMQTQVEEYIETLPESRIRRILRFRYIDDMTWVRVGFAMKSTEDAVKKEHERFFKNI